MATLYKIIKEMQLSELSWNDAELKVDDFARLFPTDETGEFSLGIFAKYRNIGILTFPNVIIGALTESWSFEVLKAFNKDEDENELGTVEIQLSNDNGSTWLYWTGAAWDVAGASDWNTEEEIQDGVSSFSFVSGSVKQIKVRVRLSPDADGISTPAVYGIAIHYELNYIPEEDVVRSLVAKLNTEVKVVTEAAVKIKGAKNNFVLPLGVEIVSVLGVWNITSDPGRLSNIYSSISSTLESETETGEKVYQHIITLTSSQSADSELLAKVEVKVSFYVAPDSDYVTSTVPKYIIELGDHDEDQEFRNDGRKYEKNKQKLKVRVRKHPQAFRLPVTILSYSPREDLTLQMNRELIRVLKHKKITSLDTAEQMQISDESDFGSANVIREDLSVKSFEFAVLYKDLQTDYEEVDMAASIETVYDLGGAYEG